MTRVRVQHVRTGEYGWGTLDCVAYAHEFSILVLWDSGADGTYRISTAGQFLVPVSVEVVL